MDLDSLKQYLIELDYPNVNFMQADEIADIFGATNRTFFLTWVANLLDKQNLPLLQPGLNTALGDIIYENGFCTLSQKDKFVTGDYIALKIDDQKFIFIQILKHLRILKKLKLKKKLFNESEVLDGESLLSFTNLEINLFPNLPVMKPITAEERKEKIEKYNANMKSLETEIENLKIALNEPEVAASATSEINFENLKESLLDFEKVNYNIHDNVNEQQSDDLSLSSDFTKISERCAQESKIISEHVKNMKILHDFKQKSFNTGTKSTDKLVICSYIEKGAESSKALLEIMKDV